MILREGSNMELYNAIKAFRRRGRYKSDREAIMALGTQAGYKKPDRIYDYVANTRRPEADNRVILADLLKRDVKVLWPPKPRNAKEAH